jgi:hypothetical protein
MSAALRRLLLFGLQFVPLFLLFLGLYVKLLPRYEPLVRGAANAITGRMTPPTQLQLEPPGGWRYTVFTPEQGLQGRMRWGHDTPHKILISLALLPALLLATPAPVTTRLRLVALGLPLLFGVHVLSVVGLMRGTEHLRNAPGTFYWLWILRGVYASGQLFAAALWLLLSWRWWFSAAGRSAAAASPGPPSS